MTITTSTTPSRNNFAAQVIGALKHDILTGYFQPGEKLLMARLKERYDVGTSPLREALSQLLVEQLVVVENQRGFRVHPISQEELEDIYETRAHIEALCVGLAIEKGGDDWEAEIMAAAHLLKKSGDLEDKTETDIHEWETRHQAFHTAIAQGCGSPTLLQVRRVLYEKAARYRNLWLKNNLVDSAAFDANQQEHEQLIEAVLQRDKQTAEALIRDHLRAPALYIKRDMQAGKLAY